MLVEYFRRALYVTSVRKNWQIEVKYIKIFQAWVTYEKSRLERCTVRGSGGAGEEDGVGGGDGTDGRAAGGTRNLEEWEIWP